MVSVKINIPENCIATFSIPVRINDINYGNHVGNDAFVSILHEARLQWLHQHSYTELDIEGVGLIMTRLEIEFKKESFYGDVINVELSTGKISGVSFELYYQLFTKRNAGLILLANAKTEMVCYDYKHKKVIAIPEKFKRILTTH